MHTARASTHGASTASLLWPARLHHVAMGSPDPHTLARFYTDHLDFSATRTNDSFILRGTDRRLIIAPGNARQLLHESFDLTKQARVAS